MNNNKNKNMNSIIMKIKKDKTKDI